MIPRAKGLRAALAASTAGCLLSWGCATRPAEGVMIDPALAIMVPSTAVSLAGVKLDTLRQTRFYGKLVEYGLLSPLEEFGRRTGLDVRHDIWEILFVFEDSAATGLVRGKFSPGFGGLEPRVLPGAPRRVYKGLTLIGDERFSVAFVNSSTAVTGPAALVRGILDRRAESSGVPAVLEEELRQLPYGSQLWTVSAAHFAGLPLPQEGNWTNLAKIARMIDSGGVALDLRNGVVLAAGASCASEEDGGRLNDALSALVAVGRLSAPRDSPEVGRFLDTIRIGRQHRRVTVKAAAGPEWLETLLVGAQSLQNNREIAPRTPIR